jgi:hypothetical protein
MTTMPRHPGEIDILWKLLWNVNFCSSISFIGISRLFDCMQISVFQVWEVWQKIFSSLKRSRCIHQVFSMCNKVKLVELHFRCFNLRRKLVEWDCEGWNYVKNIYVLRTCLQLTNALNKHKQRLSGQIYTRALPYVFSLLDSNPDFTFPSRVRCHLRHASRVTRHASRKKCERRPFSMKKQI